VTAEQTPKRRRGVITGVGVVSPIGCGADNYADALAEGRCGVRQLEDKTPELYHSNLAAPATDFHPQAYFTRAELRCLDRASQMVLAAFREAMQMAHLAPLATDNTASLVLGTTLGGMNSGLDFYKRHLEGVFRARQLLDFPPYAANDHVMAEGRLHGSSLVLSNACAAGTHAIGVASDMIRSGQADVVVAGGFDTFSDLTFAGFGVLGLMSQDAVRPFDLNRSGLVLGEGAGILIVEERQRALERGAPVLGELCGFGITSDAHHMTAPESDGIGAARAMRLALHDAGLRPDQIGYINAHGTATRKNDAAEAAAIQQVFGDSLHGIPVSSTKSMIGHTLGAAGALEIIATILMLGRGLLPATVNFLDADPECPLDVIPEGARRCEVRHALSNSFGFGGNNGCLIVEVAGNRA
jgi:3-oxoacyl-[acyl-carrier-protein] synthase II